MFKVPIVIFIYKRPDLFDKLIDVLAKIKPIDVVVISDGAKSEFDLPDVLACRDLVKNRLETFSNVTKVYSEKNLGCKQRIFTGLDFVFRKFDRAIILEEDCLPIIDAFYYFEKCLIEFDNNESIFQISGSNLIEPILNGFMNGFSSRMNCWGWATWSNRWNRVNKFYGSKDLNRICSKIEFSSAARKKYWSEIFKNTIVSNSIWDFYVQMHMFDNSLLSVIPTKNLVNNSGFDSRATHTIENKIPDYVLKNMASHDPSFSCLPIDRYINFSNNRDINVDKVLWGYSIFRLFRLKIMNQIRFLLS